MFCPKNSLGDVTRLCACAAGAVSVANSSGVAKARHEPRIREDIRKTSKIREGEPPRAALQSTARPRAALESRPFRAEAGLPGYEVSAWFGLFGPADLPAPVTSRLNAEIVRAMESKEVRERLASQGAEALSSTPEQFTAYVRDELAKWSRVVKAAGMKTD